MKSVTVPALAATALAAIVLAAPASGAPGLLAGEPTGGGNKFVGVSACGSSSCHGGKTKGNEMKVWSGKDPHSSSFEKLSEEKGVKIAKAVGIESPEEDAKCLGCHATAGAEPAGRKEKGVLAEDGVSCESCHGAGSAYKEEKHQTDHAWALANGMIDLANKETRKATCDACHGKIDEKLVAAGHPKQTTYSEREVAYGEFAHWKKK